MDKRLKLLRLALLCTIVGAISWTNICLAQSNNSQPFTGWGESVYGVQLSIGLSNNVVIADSSLNLQCRINNSSTNLIFWPVINLTQGFIVSLTNNFGKAYELIPDDTTKMMTITYSMPCKVQAGETYECSIPIKIGKNIDSGTYTLVAKRVFFTADKKSHELISNTLQVQIK